MVPPQVVPHAALSAVGLELEGVEAACLAQLVERTKAAIDKELELLHREFKKLREIKLRPANV